MTDVVIRPLTAGEESLFDSMPDPLPQLRKVSYADGIAGGGYRPEHTWIALHNKEVVARAAWLLPPGAVGRPWLERFDLVGDPKVGAELLQAAHRELGGPTIYHAAMPAHWRLRPEVLAAAGPPMTAARLAGLEEQVERLRFSWAGTPLPEPSGRYEFRAVTDEAEVRDLIARVGDPDILTGSEIARQVGGVDLATDPLGWLPRPQSQWQVATVHDTPVGVIATAGDACYPLLVYLAAFDESARGELIAAAVRALQDEAYEVIADAEARKVAVVADLERTGFRQLRARVTFAPTPAD